MGHPSPRAEGPGPLFSVSLERDEVHPVGKGVLCCLGPGCGARSRVTLWPAPGSRWVLGGVIPWPHNGDALSLMEGAA